jgi:hypothetical protein
MGKMRLSAFRFPFVCASMIRKSGTRFSDKDHAQTKCWTMIEPKAGPTAGSGVTRSCYEGRFPVVLA